MGFDDAMRTLGYSGKETGLMSQKTFETSYQLQKAEQLVKEFPSFFYQPEPKIIRTTLDVTENLMDGVFAKDAQPLVALAPLTKAGRYAVFQFIAVCQWVLMGRIVLPTVENIAGYGVPADIAGKLIPLNAEAAKLQQPGADYDAIKAAIITKIIEITAKQADFPMMMWHPAFDPDTRDAFLSHTFARHDNTGFITHPVATVLK